MSELTEWLKEKRVYAAVVVLSMAIFAGQVVDVGAFSLEDLPDILLAVIDPIQYMVGMLIIGYILVVTSIRKYESLPNPILNTLKWYFTILFINDFIVLVFRVIQKSNILSFSNSFTGAGMIYLILASMRSITDSTISSAAACLLAYGLSRYKFVDDDGPLSVNKFGRIIIIFVLLKWAFSIPVNMTGLLTNQTIFVTSLIMSLSSGLLSAVLMYLIVKELQKRYKTKFFENLKWYFGTGLVAVLLNFAYSIGTYGLLQRFPAGEIEMMGGFGKLVLFVSLLIQAVQTYYIYGAISGYNEGEAIDETITVESPRVTVAGG